MSLSTSFRIVYRATSQFGENGGAQMGAALAYYALFSTAPLLILAVMSAGLVFGAEAARNRVEKHLTEMVGAKSAGEITTWMEQATQPAQGTVAIAVGIGLLLLGTLGIFLHLRRCLCLIWKLEPPGGGGFLRTLLNYLLAIIAVGCVGLLLLLSLAASTATALLVELMDEHLPGGGALWYWLEVGVSFLLLTLFFALVYRVLSSWRIPWAYVWYGSFVVAVLFTIGKTVIALYLAYSTPGSVYGAAGSAVVFLVWVYYSSQIVFFGAELIQARRTRHEWLEGAKVPR